MRKGECEVAIIQPKIEIVLNPSQPVQEILSVISAVCAFHPGNESKVLKGIELAIHKRLQELENPNEESSAE